MPNCVLCSCTRGTHSAAQPCANPPQLEDDCYYVDEQVCDYENRTKTVEEPYMNCTRWEEQECTCHHKQVPYQVEKQILIKAYFSPVLLMLHKCGEM